MLVTFLGTGSAIPISRRTKTGRLHAFRAVHVPHAPRTWGYVIDGRLAYFSDYADLGAALPSLRRGRAAVLDGSGWNTAFPSHQPMAEVIPILRRLRNLDRIFFTHNGHLHVPRRELDRRVKAEGDRRFAIAFHGLRVRI